MWSLWEEIQDMTGMLKGGFSDVKFMMEGMFFQLMAKILTLDEN